MQNQNVLYYYNILNKKKKVIISIVLTVTIISTVIAFLLPKWYYSSATIRPADEKGLSIFSAMLGAKGLASIGQNLSIGGLQYSELDYYKTLLSSRKTTTQIIEEYDLQNIYDEEYMFKTIARLLENSEFNPDPKANVIHIGAFDTEPNRAQKMVSSYLKLLEDQLLSIENYNNRFNREFIEKRYIQNRNDLDRWEDSLQSFQKKYKVVIPEEQFVTTVEASAEIEAQKLLLETQLAALTYNQGEDSPGAKTLQHQIKTLDQKLRGILQGTNDENGLDLLLSINNAPTLMRKYIHYYREVQIQSELMKMIYPLYEQAKMEELKVTTPFEIIDSPYLPEYKAKPKRAVIMISGFLVSFILTVMSILLADYVRRLKTDESA